MCRQVMIPVTPDFLNNLAAAQAQAAQQSSLTLSSASSLKPEPRSPHRKQAGDQSSTIMVAAASTHAHAGVTQLPLIIQAAIGSSPGSSPEDYDDAPKTKRSRPDGEDFDS